MVLVKFFSGFHVFVLAILTPLMIDERRTAANIAIQAKSLASQPVRTCTYVFRGVLRSIGSCTKWYFVGSGVGYRRRGGTSCISSRFSVTGWPLFSQLFRYPE